MTPEEKRAAANEASRRSREKRKAAELAATQGVDIAGTLQKFKTLRDYADALRPNDLASYTHKVVLPNGETFSVHKSAEEAATARDRLKSEATVEPFTPNLTTYWTTGEPRYDH